MLKAVIFDLDGTLVDSVSLHAQAWQVAFKEHGYYIPYQFAYATARKGYSSHVL